MIGNTLMEKQLQKALTLDDALAWYEANTPQIKKLVLNLIRQDQLFERGVNKFDEVIGLYSPFTEQINPTKRAGTPYTLKDTGAFYQSMFITVLKDSILINADASVMQDQLWWNTNILGLDEQNLEIYAEQIRKQYIKYARKILGIN
tara:strand:+ start:360 stop:800 length:441 start_codon:yes stop_codon:yes gene_type:complete